MELTQKHCVPCEGGTPPMTKKEAEGMMTQVPGWQLMQDAKKGQLSLGREFEFADFTGSMDFVNKVAELANAEDHHPDIYIFYNRVKLQLSTHAVSGLSENDFILASKINQLADHQR